MKQFLIEIGSEEIPARFVSKGLSLLKEEIVKLFEDAFISYGNISEFSTPRRIALVIDNVAEKEEDRTIETMGPPRKAAFDGEGNPTKAATGFARSLNIDVKDLAVKMTDKGEYISATLEKKGRQTISVLSETLPEIISSLQLPKSMRWGSSSLRYFRPIQWIVALYGTSIVPFEVETVKSSNTSFGHRFLSPAAIKITKPSLYASILKQNHVIADGEERKSSIAKAISDIETSYKCSIYPDDELLDIVTNLVEYPTAVLGDFEDKYLALPRELLITVMKSHQKYFSVEDSDGNMKSSFVVVSNMNSPVNETVRRGAERVLRARLEDARFYFIEDQKIKLWDYVDELKKVTYQEKLGSLYEKAQRMSSLSEYLAEIINPELKEKAQRSSMLSKADLVTGVVGEFPELQGYMGMTYASNSGEDSETASAIFEHYLPRHAGDSLPSGSLGTIISLADKIDNIASFFYLDMIPSGSEDPFALRRQAAGIINIMQKNDYPASLNSLIDTALCNHESSESKRDELTQKIVLFFVQRLEGILLAQGYSHDVINAVLASDEIILKDVKDKISILTELKKHSRFPALLMSAKRVYNILSKSGSGKVDESLFSHDSEKELHGIARKVNDSLISSGYNSLFELEEPVNKFFDDVLVMDKDPRIKDNRLALLQSVKSCFDALGNFSIIVE